MSSAREEILARVRRASGPGLADPQAEYAAIARTYIQSGLMRAQERVDLFIDRLHDYGSDVWRCREDQIADAVAEILDKRNKSRVLIPSGFPDSWRPGGGELIVDENLSVHAIDEIDSVLTGCAIAIAFTGTIVLRHSAAEGRRAITLIPDYHLCVVFEEQIVETVPEAMREIASFGSAPITTISGSSATADIEMTRVKGVHGPRTLDVILVG